MKNTGRVTILAASLFVALSSSAAVPKKQAQHAPAKILVGQGVAIGGLAGSGFTLMDIRRTADAKKKMERIVIDVGDHQGNPLKGYPGYYHAELQKNPQRLVLDFAQMPKSRLDELMISSRLKNSLAIRNSEMSLDPVENSLNLTLNLKPNTKVRVYQVAGVKSTSKVVVDLIAE